MLFATWGPFCYIYTCTCMKPILYMNLKEWALPSLFQSTFVVFLESSIFCFSTLSWCMIGKKQQHWMLFSLLRLRQIHVFMWENTRILPHKCTSLLFSADQSHIKKQIHVIKIDSWLWYTYLHETRIGKFRAPQRKNHPTLTLAIWAFIFLGICKNIKTDY